MEEKSFEDTLGFSDKESVVARGIKSHGLSSVAPGSSLNADTFSSNIRLLSKSASPRNAMQEVASSRFAAWRLIP